MSSKPLFACVLCGENFTRNSSAKRHRRIVHDSLIVRYIEYVAGRASGQYPQPITPPRMSRRKSKSVKFQGEDMQQNSPSFITADSSADDISCENTGKNNNIVGIGNNNARGTYSPAYLSMQMKGKKVDVIDVVINDARKLVEFKDLCAKLSSYSQSTQTVMSLQPNFNIFQFNEALNIQALDISNSRRPFGFRIYTCERCLESPIVPVFYPDMGQGTNQAIHRCRPDRLADIGRILDKREHVLPLKDNSIQLLEQIITGSQANRYNYLVGSSTIKFSRRDSTIAKPRKTPSSTGLLLF